MSAYGSVIAAALARIGRADVPIEVMEAAMRAEFGTLDHLDAAAFRREAPVAAGMWDADPETCRRMAESYGLRPPDCEPPAPALRKASRRRPGPA